MKDVRALRAVLPMDGLDTVYFARCKVKVTSLPVQSPRTTTAHGGSIDKFIGDAIMAVFLPTHGMAPPGERAIRAAFGMRRELDAFNEARRMAGEFAIAIGSGIATGQILMGILGRSDGRQDFTVTGPTVNKSAAMEKRSKETRRTPIVACPATIEAVTVPVETEPLPDASDRPAGFEVASIDDSGVSLIHSRK